LQEFHHPREQLARFRGRSSGIFRRTDGKHPDYHAFLIVSRPKIVHIPQSLLRLLVRFYVVGRALVRNITSAAGLGGILSLAGRQ
jgi:hypothetical protein